MITLDAETARRVRRAADLILRLVADPDAPVHARDPEDHRGLCHRGGNYARQTDEPSLVTCGACTHTVEWDAWCWRRAVDQIR